MKTIILSLSTIIFALAANAQCAYDNTIYLTGPAPTTVGATVTGPDTWGGDFNRVTGFQAGFTYEISTCIDPSFDSEITIYPSGGGSPVAYDDDGCGITGGASKVLFTPTVSGDYDILLDEFGCLHNSIDMDMTITLVSTGGGGNPGALNIPVVVHVIYKNSTENVSDAQIMSQIEVLNEDYRKLNADFSQTPAAFQPLGADMDITFCLASVDPNGNATSGITRTSTTTPVFSHATEPKFASNGGHENWDPSRYLNIWVCDLDGGLLGYATFPADLATDPQLDGVVIDYAFFGRINATAPFDKGRTATHEVGHWLNLRHIWGDATCGDDFVGDTPTQEQSNGGCPSFPHTSCNNGPNGDMFMNYMDYTDDACMFMFTNGQKARAGATISNIRNGLGSSNGCGITSVKNIDNHPVLSIYPNPASGEVTLSCTIFREETSTVSIKNSQGAEVMNVKTERNADGKISLDISGLRTGIYIAEIESDRFRSVNKLVVR